MKTLSFLCILLFLCSEVFGKLIQAPTGDGVEFLLSEECLKGRGRLNLRRNDDSAQLIASLENVWKPGPQHPHRVNQRGLFLILENADLNDEGLYEFTCNGKDLEAIKLEVFVPSEVDVSEGEDATLPCRSVTAGQSVKSARWRRNGNAVLQLDGTGGITYGEDFVRSRVSIPSEWDRQADLSLTIKRVQQQDEGVYYCDIDKWEKHRSAVRLRVHPQVPTAPGSTPLPTTTPTPSECSDWSWRTFSITAAVFVIVGLLVWLCWFLRNRIFKVCTRSFGGGSSEQEEEINLKSVTINNSDGHLCNGTEEGGEGTEEGRESGSDQHSMLKSNGNHDFTHN